MTIILGEFMVLLFFVFLTIMKRYNITFSKKEISTDVHYYGDLAKIIHNDAPCIIDIIQREMIDSKTTREFSIIVSECFKNTLNVIFNFNDVIFDGSGVESFFLYLPKCKHITVKCVTFRNFKKGVCFSRASKFYLENIVFKNCNIFNVQYIFGSNSAMFEAKNITIDSCFFYRSSVFFTYASTVSYSGFCVKDCIFEQASLVYSVMDNVKIYDMDVFEISLRDSFLFDCNYKPIYHVDNFKMHQVFLDRSVIFKSDHVGLFEFSIVQIYSSYNLIFLSYSLQTVDFMNLSIVETYTSCFVFSDFISEIKVQDIKFRDSHVNYFVQVRDVNQSTMTNISKQNTIFKESLLFKAENYKLSDHFTEFSVGRLSLDIHSQTFFQISHLGYFLSTFILVGIYLYPMFFLRRRRFFSFNMRNRWTVFNRND